MDGHVPEIYWFLFWIFLTIVAFGSAFMAGRGGHIAKMQALDVLKKYAEQGMEPPPEVAGPLLRQISGMSSDRPLAQRSERARHLERFCFHAFMAGAGTGVAWWRMAAGEPTWVAYAAVIVALAFGAGAVAALIAALVSARE
jgi:hypothetical protein